MFAFVCFTAFGHCNVCLCLAYGFWPRKPNKGKHHNGQKPQAKQRQASQWPKAVNQRKANITMAKSHKPKKGKHYNGQKP
jgi:hypothetical protein